MLFNVARLDANALKSIQALEQEMGKTLIAFKGFEADPATVSEDELGRIQALESALGVALVAVDS